MSIEFGVEIMEHPSIISKLSLLESPRSSSSSIATSPGRRPVKILEFSFPFEILMHDRDSKVRASTQIMEFFASTGFGILSHSRFIPRARSVFSVTVRPAPQPIPGLTEKDVKFGRTRSGSFSFSNAVAEGLIREGSASRSMDGIHGLGRTRSTSTLPRDRTIGFSTPLNYYVRGEENLGMWKPKGAVLVARFVEDWRRRKWVGEVELGRHRVDEYIVTGAMIRAEGEESRNVVKNLN
ncbi:hypothetical protein BC829DRAFT_210089 [Chytridium lagenaria]|nr:hypothetical protein BC829DRAFT_210089 [Chytridium lagenaria]